MILYWLTRVLFGAFARIFLRLKVEGLEKLPQKGRGFILASNHASSLDPFVLIAAIPRYLRWTVIYEYFDQWCFKWMLRKMRFIRLGKSLPKEAFRALRQGEILGIFPEGRRSWDGNLGQGRPGMAALARRTGCPVVPLAIAGSYQALPRIRKRLRLRPITVRIGKPLFFSTAVGKKEDSQDLDEQNARQVMAAIRELLEG